MGSSLVKPNMIPLPLPPRRTIPPVSQIIWNTVRNPHILDNEGYSNISDNILISAWPVQLRDICGPIFPQDQLPFPKLYFIVGFAVRQGAQKVPGTVPLQCSGPLRLLIWEAGQEMCQLWPVIVEEYPCLQIYLGHNMPTDVEVCVFSRSYWWVQQRSFWGCFLRICAQSHLYIHVLSAVPTTAIKTPSLGQSVGHTCV